MSKGESPPPVPDRVKLDPDVLAETIGGVWPREQIEVAVGLLNRSQGRFPSRARKLPAALITALQRERLLAAMVRASAELGYRDAHVQDVIERAGVSRPTFYEHFANKEDCFLAALDMMAERLRRRIVGAAQGGGDSLRERVRLALEALLEFAAAEPDAVRMVLVESRAGSPAALRRCDALLEYFASLIDARVGALAPQAAEAPEATAAPALPAPNSVTATGIVGGIGALLYARLARREVDNLESLMPSLMYFAMAPYTARETAGEELALAAH